MPELLELKIDYLARLCYSIAMEPVQRVIILDHHIIEAWGLWWIQWQKDQMTLLRRAANGLVRTESKNPRLNTTS